jgi:hypothetical protein
VALRCVPRSVERVCVPRSVEIVCVPLSVEILCVPRSVEIVCVPRIVEILCVPRSVEILCVYIIKLKCICWLIHFTNIINARSMEHIKMVEVVLCICYVYIGVYVMLAV